MAKTQPISKWFIFWWVLATVAGMLAAFVVLVPLLLSVDYVGGGSPALYFGLAAAFAVAGALVGTAQWLVLRRRAAVTAAWIGASALGLALVAGVILLLDRLPGIRMQEIFAAILFPLAVGAPQAYALQNKVAQPWYWLGVTYAALLVFFGFYIFGPRSGLTTLGIYLSYPLITGVGMWWLLSQSSATPAPAKRAAKRPTRKR